MSPQYCFAFHLALSFQATGFNAIDPIYWDWAKNIFALGTTKLCLTHNDNIDSCGVYMLYIYYSSPFF